MSRDVVGTRDVSRESIRPGKYYRKQLLECLASWLYMFKCPTLAQTAKIGSLANSTANYKNSY